MGPIGDGFRFENGVVFILVDGGYCNEEDKLSRYGAFAC